MTQPRYTLHFTPADSFDALDPSADYTPPDYEREGFIHCTDGAENLARVGNAYYLDDSRDFYVLTIDKERVKSPIKYEDAGRIYPHVYGPLNRDAIVNKRTAERLQDGTFAVMAEE